MDGNSDAISPKSSPSMAGTPAWLKPMICVNIWESCVSMPLFTLIDVPNDSEFFVTLDCFSVNQPTYHGEEQDSKGQSETGKE